MAKYEEVMIGLKQGKYAPAYMLCGKEPYYIDKVADYIEQNVLDEMAREFDQTIIYGKDLSSGDVSPVIGAARGFAMLWPIYSTGSPDSLTSNDFPLSSGYSSS